MDDKIELVIELLESHKDRLNSIDTSLREHMRRTDILEQLHRDNQARILGLEEPGKAKEYLKSAIIDFSKFSGAILSVLAILRYLGKI